MGSIVQPCDELLRALRHVILPQATRIAIGPTVGFGVQA